ncbi:MAG: RdgB/HAM1 family non-canonical purine NTP pyrophosphatase [Bacteroidales bacterium]|nr:RdgB/HAM1 family non-canonical purine NTP pyrophosphatase [Bacteroidales bacterium]MDZ4203382.1 RdgB/HAM1 family non-canonical purine NTP pyrophosphatase [Bacteroidales bacterium]
MPKKLVFATQNKHKIIEVTDVITKRLYESGNNATQWEILSLSDLGGLYDIPETALSLEGNALLKAMYVVDRFGFDCFADDTGLEIDALDGRPGIYSARYAGENKNFEDNINKVLKELRGIENRKARFRTVVALVIKNHVHYFEGIMNGQIIHSKRGSGGFGYDSVFLPECYDRTFAEMTLDEKNQVSHRAIAINRLCDFLNDYRAG